LFFLAKESPLALSNRYELNISQNEISSSSSPTRRKIIQFEEENY
jgi:hypothetical protein